jgi:hypothetical protein
LERIRHERASLLKLRGRAAQTQRWTATVFMEESATVPGLDVFWEDERGGILEKCPSQFNVWDYVTDPQELHTTCCLQFIDEYGDTTFNQSQISVLVQELEVILPNSKNEKARQSLESLIAFGRKAEGNIHTYLKFIGD